MSKAAVIAEYSAWVEDFAKTIRNPEWECSGDLRYRRLPGREAEIVFDTQGFMDWLHQELKK